MCIPVFFHNFTGYDNHLFIKVLGRSEGDIKVIARNDEKQVSVSKDIPMARKVKWSLRFLDSAQLILGSLSSHVKNLMTVGKDSLRLMHEHFSGEQLDLLLRKGVFPYEWMTNISKLNETNLPSKKDFYCSLNDEHISNEDYQHAQRVWSTFEMTTMREYHDLYLRTDVLLLADVFKEFRKKMLEYYELDPCLYYTAPGMSWDAMLKMTDPFLELISDQSIYEFIDRGKRGGVSTITTRYAKAKNPYMFGYDPKKEVSYIMYLDANNLYGWAMSLPLPVGNFR